MVLWPDIGIWLRGLILIQFNFTQCIQKLNLLIRCFNMDLNSIFHSWSKLDAHCWTLFSGTLYYFTSARRCVPIHPCMQAVRSVILQFCKSLTLEPLIRGKYGEGWRSVSYWHSHSLSNSHWEKLRVGREWDLGGQWLEILYDVLKLA